MSEEIIGKTLFEEEEQVVKRELDKDELEIFKYSIGKHKELSALCKQFEVSELVILGYINELKESGKNIFLTKENGVYYVNDFGDMHIDHNEYKVEDFKDKKILKFGLLSDTRFGSKYQQLSIVNDFYQKAYNAGVDFFIHCGDISEGKYTGEKEKYNESLFAHGAEEQAGLISSQYPYVNGIKTYFITGDYDQTHMKGKGKRDIGKLIAEEREDMVYLGLSRCFMTINNLRIYIDHKVPRLAKQNIQLSYRPQRTIATMRSEDKVNMLLQGHSLYQQAFKNRGVQIVTAPSMVATTPEMRDYEISNTVGAWIIYLELNKGKIEKIRPCAMPDYVTREDDYLSAKKLVLINGGK